MKRLPNTSILLLVTILALGLSTASCKKLQQNYIMNGQWDVLDVRLNDGSLNQMEQFLPDYKTADDCCSYVMSFGDDGVSSAIYTLNGEVQYVTTGEWNMPERSTLYFKVDEYVDGVFTLEKEGDGIWILHAPLNNIDAYGIGEVDMKIRTRRIKD